MTNYSITEKQLEKVIEALDDWMDTYGHHGGRSARVQELLWNINYIISSLKTGDTITVV